MQEVILITNSVVFSGIVGLVAPFIFPYIFKLFSKIAKKEASKSEKRLIINIFALIISIGLAAYSYDWGEEFLPTAWEFIIYIFTSFTVFRGIVQSVYELIIKSFPSLEERLEKIEK